MDELVKNQNAALSQTSSRDNELRVDNRPDGVTENAALELVEVTVEARSPDLEMFESLGVVDLLSDMLELLDQLAILRIQEDGEE